MGMISFLNMKPKRVEEMRPENIVVEEPKVEPVIAPVEEEKIGESIEEVVEVKEEKPVAPRRRTNRK